MKIPMFRNCFKQMTTKLTARFTFVVLLFVFSKEKVFAQNQMPDYFTPVISSSPAVASLGKYGDLPIDLSTGASSASVPLYSLSLRGNYSLDFALNYSSNGVIVDDVAGNVGTDWSFMGQFAIKRTIFDDADESSTDYAKLFENTGNSMLDQIVSNGETYNRDVQPDLFTLVAPGFSGKFILSGEVLYF